MYMYILIKLINPMDLKKVEKQGGEEKASRTPPHYGTMLASNAMHLHPQFTLLLTQQGEPGMQVHCVGGQRVCQHRSVVG